MGPAIRKKQIGGDLLAETTYNIESQESFVDGSMTSEAEEQRWERKESS